MQKTA